MTWIRDKLLGLRAVFFGGERLPDRGALEFAGDGVTVEDDPVNKRTKVTITGGGGEPAAAPREYVVQHPGGPAVDAVTYVVSPPIDVALELSEALIIANTLDHVGFELGEGMLVSVYSTTSGNTEFTEHVNSDFTGSAVFNDQFSAMSIAEDVIPAGRRIVVSFTAVGDIETPRVSVVLKVQPVEG
ncbi:MULTISPECIES: hypothetical protein [Sorangium]|uniref:hypothetical protein n=1 Tax=Sorangium TaxID=39643 RepID=UPI003D9C1489